MQNMYMLPFRGLAITACHPAARAKDHSKKILIHVAIVRYYDSKMHYDDPVWAADLSGRLTCLGG